MLCNHDSTESSGGLKLAGTGFHVPPADKTKERATTTSMGGSSGVAFGHLSFPLRTMNSHFRISTNILRNRNIHFTFTSKFKLLEFNPVVSPLEQRRLEVTPASRAIRGRMPRPSSMVAPLGRAAEDQPPSPNRRVKTDVSNRRSTHVPIETAGTGSAKKGRAAGRRASQGIFSGSRRRLSAPGVRRKSTLMPNPGGAGFNGRRKSSVSIPAFLQATAFEEEEAEEEDFIVFADMSASMRVRLCLYDTLEAKTTSAILFAFSLYALFSEDIRLLGCPNEADLAFEVLSTIAFILFFLEMVINSVVDMERDPKYFKPSSQTWFERTCRYQGYVLGFYFWLDLVAWLSLIFDMPWLLGAIGTCGATCDVWPMTGFDILVVAALLSGSPLVCSGLVTAK